MVNRILEKDGVKFGLIHVPRSAGTSIMKVCKVVEEDVLPGAFEGLEVLSVTRNCFERLVSAWKYYCGIRAAYGWPNIELSLFLAVAVEMEYFWMGKIGEIPREKYLLWKDRKGATRKARWKEWIWEHAIPATHWVHPWDSLSLNLRYPQELQGGVNAFFKKLGIRPVELPRERETVHRHYSAYYRKDVRAAAEAFYYGDMEALDHEFEEVE